MLVPQINSIIANVDRIHAELPYIGGRLPIRQVVEHYPGLSLTACDALPRGVDTVMHRERGVARILYRGDMRKTRLRFQVAAQIGHAFLHAGHMPGFGLRSTARTSDEIRHRQAQLFASELLCPLWALELALPSEIVEDMPYAEIDREVLRGLGVHFGLSQAALRIRIEGYRQTRRTQAGRAPA